MLHNNEFKQQPVKQEFKLENGLNPSFRPENNANSQSRPIYVLAKEPNYRSGCIKIIVIVLGIAFVVYMLNRSSCDVYILSNDDIKELNPKEWDSKKIHSWDDLLFSQYRNEYGWVIDNIWTVEGSKTESGKFSCQTPLYSDEESNISKRTQNKMNGRWPSDYNRFGTYDETCARQVEQLNTENKFLDQGMKWHDQYNIDETLGKCHIFANDSKMFSYTEIYECFRKRFNVETKIGCRSDMMTLISNKYTLYEIGFCFDHKLRLKNCTNVADPYFGFQYCGEEFTYPATFPFNI